MQLVLMHHKGGTVYFAAQDKGGSGKVFRMKSEGKSLVFIQNVTTSYAWTQNKKFCIPWETVMGFTKRDGRTLQYNGIVHLLSKHCGVQKLFQNVL